MPVSNRIEADQVGIENLSICRALRRAVFVDEQGVPDEIEVDGLDESCTHFLAWVSGVPIGTARLRVVDGQAKAERVAVLEDFRGHGAGRVLMNVLELGARAQGLRSVLVHAQEQVVPFYERLGYVACGERFMEASIPHVPMRKEL
ncbi:MAG: GNAT family N-acetyltransferase [Thermodesulfobacteriota bacterium]